ncbi:nuclear transport factor 2 family protein [Halobacillus mangrovi]|uniref:nuclear transport factor 2 family protein n=1 Tax=Halobacillus mangrovi TaxID=402384 RepID=UPI003D99FA3E
MNNREEDLEVICDDDCGNAPKKQLIKEFNLAFATNNVEFVISCVSDDIKWNIVGDQFIQGKKAFSEALQQMKESNISKIHMKNIITHGRTGAADGTLFFNGGKQIHFCDIIMFTSAGKQAKIKELTSYVIEES